MSRDHRIEATIVFEGATLEHLCHSINHARVKELEAENAQLREDIAKLTNRLAFIECGMRVVRSETDALLIGASGADKPG
jgi:hypothetical protein